MKDENEDPWGPNKGAPWGPNKGASKGQKWLKWSKIFFFYFAPIQFTLATDFHYSYSAPMQGELKKIIDKYEGPWGAHQGVPEGPKMASGWLPRINIGYF